MGAAVERHAWQLLAEEFVYVFACCVCAPKSRAQDMATQTPYYHLAFTQPARNGVLDFAIVGALRYLFGGGGRCAPGDVVMGEEFNGRIHTAWDDGRLTIVADDGHQIWVASESVTALRVIERCDAPMRRCAHDNGWWLDLTALEEAA
jgi:hypothetical protein